MTTTLTAMPEKITKSTMRFFDDMAKNYHRDSALYIGGSAI